MHRKSLPLPLFVFAILAWLPSAAWAAAAGVETLPGVENESTSATVPAITTDAWCTSHGRGAGQAPAMAESEPAARLHPFRLAQGDGSEPRTRSAALTCCRITTRCSDWAAPRWPNGPTTPRSKNYVRRPGEKLAQPAAPTDKESALIRRLRRDENREKELKALLHKVGETGRTPAPVAATTHADRNAGSGRRARTPAVVPTVSPAAQRRARPSCRPPANRPWASSRPLLGKPAVLARSAASSCRPDRRASCCGASPPPERSRGRVQNPRPPRAGPPRSKSRPKRPSRR